MNERNAKIKTICFLFFIVIVAALFACSNTINNEITPDNAIQIAANYANKNNFNTQKADSEILKVKKGRERGPIRLVWLVRQFPKEKTQSIINKEFWIIYFYPKGQLEKADTLGGDYCVLVDLYSGKVIGSFTGL